VNRSPLTAWLAVPSGAITNRFHPVPGRAPPPVVVVIRVELTTLTPVAAIARPAGRCPAR
jgi:hypothetical protein